MSSCFVFYKWNVRTVLRDENKNNTLRYYHFGHRNCGFVGSNEQSWNFFLFWFWKTIGILHFNQPGVSYCRWKNYNPTVVEHQLKSESIYTYKKPWYPEKNTMTTFPVRCTIITESDNLDISNSFSHLKYHAWKKSTIESSNTNTLQ